MSIPEADRLKVLETVESMRDEILDFLKTLIRFRTPNPPGGNTVEAQSWMADRLREMGFQVEVFDVFPGDPDVVGVLKGSGGGRSIILNGHMDVAEVRKDEPWKHDPFEPVLEDGLLYGRGSTDMKGGLTAMVVAVEAVKRSGFELLGDVVVESVVGEEVGEPGTVKCIERGYRADFAVVPEPTGFKVCGQGGVITGWVVIKSPVTLHDGVRRLCIHAGGGLEGANAIEKMVKIITALQELERHWAVVKRHPLLPPGSTTINPAVIEGGRHPAFMADECRLWITVHYLPTERYEDVVREIEDYLMHVAMADPWMRKHPPKFKWGGKSLTKDRGEIFPPADVDPNHPGVKTLLECHKAVTGSETEVAMWPSVSDAGWLSRAGIPTVIYGPGELTQAHAVNEYVRFEDVVKATKVLALMLMSWCGYKKVGD